MVTILAAGGLLMTMMAAALAVDLGSVFLDSRRLQGLADATALAAANDLGDARGAAAGMVAAGNWPGAQASEVTTGTYAADAGTAAAARFAAGGTDPNAVRTVLTAQAPLFFGRVLGLDHMWLSRRATAARIDLAAFSLGSRLASVNGGLLNALLGGLAGGSITLSMADYQALAAANVDLLDYVRALRTGLGLSGASFDQTLAASTSLPPALTALSAALAGEGQGAAAAAVARVASAAGGLPLPLSQLISLGPLGAQDHAVPGQQLTANVLDLLSAALQVAGAGRQVSLDLGSGIPGLASAKVTLLVGARAANSPWLAVTATATPVIHTSQIRLKVDAGIGGSPALALLGIKTVRLPLYLELAQASARLTALDCRRGARRMTVEAQPSIGHVSIADVDAAAFADPTRVPAETPAALVAVTGITVTGAARVDLSSNAWQSIPFAEADIAAHAVKTVQSSGVAQAIATSLEQGMAITVKAGPLAIGLSGLTALLLPVLDLIAPLVDALLDQILGLLGIHLGQADVRADGTRCGTAALVG